MAVTIVDYGSGNLRSAAKAFEKYSNARVIVTATPDVVAAADRIVLPGQGSFYDCSHGLASLEGMREALCEAVIDRGVPFLGICVGMQLMATAGLEHGYQAGLDWIPGQVQQLPLTDPNLKIPHMGWNNLKFRYWHPVFEGIESGEHVYFVHSYHFVTWDPSTLIATTDYGGDTTAIISKDNMIGTQFHPEKSQATGLRIVENFLKWRP